MKTYSQSILSKTWLSALSLAALSATASANEKLTWNGALSSDDPVSKFIRTAVVGVMAIFVMISIILGALAFKQLANDGNWKDFWSKIAGSVGMFVVPILIYWLVGQGTPATT